MIEKLLSFSFEQIALLFSIIFIILLILKNIKANKTIKMLKIKLSFTENKKGTTKLDKLMREYLDLVKNSEDFPED